MATHLSRYFSIFEGIYRETGNLSVDDHSGVIINLPIEWVTLVIIATLDLWECYFGPVTEEEEGDNRGALIQLHTEIQ